jgi:predicted Zn finger-like uncharacterized protein
VSSTIRFTRCPQCRTTFRITSQQLALREGQARCGHCRTVFNAFGALVDFKGARAPAPGMESMQRETMTLFDSVSLSERDFHVMPLSPSPIVASVQKTVLPSFSETETIDDTSPSLRSFTHEKSASQLQETAFFDETDDDEEDPPYTKKPRKSRPSPLELVLDPAQKPSIWQRLHLPRWCRPLFYLISLSGLTVLLAAQATFFRHDELASAYPILTPALSQGCRWLHCEIKPLQNLNALMIEASDLQSYSHDAQQLLLTVTVRNRSDKPVALPSLSLELTDERGKLLVRQLFAPEMYLIRAADINIGVPASRDLVLRLLLRSGVTASGYRLSLVYS